MLVYSFPLCIAFLGFWYQGNADFMTWIGKILFNYVSRRGYVQIF